MPTKTDPNTDAEKLLRDMSASKAIRFGNIAPHKFGEPFVEERGFAHYISVSIEAHCKTIESVIPRARQLVFQFLADNDVPNETVDLVPWVTCAARQRCFTDENPASPTRGKTKRGKFTTIRFVVKEHHKHRFMTIDGKWQIK